MKWLVYKFLPKIYSFTNIIYSIYMYKHDLALLYLQGLMYRNYYQPTNQPTNHILIIFIYL